MSDRSNINRAIANEVSRAFIPTVTPRPGDIGLVATHNGDLLDKLAGWAIRFGTDSPVNHCFLYVGNGQIVEAVARVKISPVTNYSDIIWSTGRLGDRNPTDAQRELIVKYALASVGERYNVLDIVAIALAQRRLGATVDGREWWVKRLSDDHMEMCSQLCVNGYRAAGDDLCPGKLSGLESPGDVLNLLQ